jgi:FeS assembly protein IscX
MGQEKDIEDALTWDDSFAIARALMAVYPNAALEQVKLQDIYQWTMALPDFDDDPQLSNDAILMAIYQEWLEEVNPL